MTETTTTPPAAAAPASVRGRFPLWSWPRPASPAPPHPAPPDRSADPRPGPGRGRAPQTTRSIHPSIHPIRGCGTQIIWGRTGSCAAEGARSPSLRSMQNSFPSGPRAPPIRRRPVGAGRRPSAPMPRSRSTSSSRRHSSVTRSRCTRFLTWFGSGTAINSSANEPSGDSRPSGSSGALPLSGSSMNPDTAAARNSPSGRANRLALVASPNLSRSHVAPATERERHDPQEQGDGECVRRGTQVTHREPVFFSWLRRADRSTLAAFVRQDRVIEVRTAMWRL